MEVEYLALVGKAALGVNVHAVTILLSLCLAVLVGCGVAGPSGDQGPAGPQGPTGASGPQGEPGASSGGQVVLSVPDNEAERYLSTRGANPTPTWTFNLAAQSQIPANATAIYLDVAGCIPAGSSSPAALTFKTPEATAEQAIYVVRSCSLMARESKAVWFPTAAQTLVVEARESQFNPAALTVRVKVLGWYLP